MNTNTSTASRGPKPGTLAPILKPTSPHIRGKEYRVKCNLCNGYFTWVGAPGRRPERHKTIQLCATPRAPKPKAITRSRAGRKK